MTTSSKRAEHIARASLILSIVFFGIVFFVGRWSGFFALSAISWLILSAALIWFVLAIQFHQRALAEQEKLDMGQLAESKQATTIFQAGGERAVMFAVAQRRLDLLEKWFIPIFSAIIAAYQIAIGLYLLKAVQAAAEHEAKQPLVCAACMTAVAFVSFIISRYATGMSAQLQWKPLRAGGSILLGIAILCFALAISLALAQFKIFIVINVIDLIVPILLLAIGAETALNIVFDIYRPRLKGQYAKSAFDSRLLGTINEPGGLFRTAASTIDYQFGFKVSQTWFYKLLEKAIAPLILFAAVTLYLLSCIVVVNPNEEAIIEHFGNPLSETNQVRLAKPGLTFKWPWPIDITYKHPTKMVSEISIGFVPKYKPGTKELDREPLLWGKAHYEKEDLLLVASEQTSSKTAAGAVPVSLIVATVPVQYKIKDLYSFIYNHNEPEKLLESICYHELTRFAASAKIEVNDEASINQSLLGAGRAEAERTLISRIQAAADEAGLGVEIIFLGLQGIHPPPQVAGDYQKVIGAVQKKQALILGAYAERNKVLSALAGSVEDADRLYSLAAKYQQVKEKNQPKEIEKLANDLDSAFAEAKGKIFSTLREAQSYAFEKATLAQATGQRFDSQLKAYRAAKEIYKQEQRLAALEEALENTRKYVVVADQNDTQVFIFDAQDKLTPSLYELSGLQESNKK
ncbi:MAG: SPFH domain-containing protein [Phycisphaerae bacterium]|nr:SPFH domain-containing protein [Phycisphaerae bacterium]MDD5381388.1 SPFH domain-containing protein [Phycisphaerae bacterium]